MLEQVLQINPSYVDAENLLTRIAIQGDVAKWFEQFKAAKAKGDFQTQIRALEQIVSADTQNHEAHELLAQIKQQSAINHFERLVEQVLEAIKNQQVEEAKNALRKAQQAEPQNPIIATLKTQVQTLSDNQQTQQFSEQLKLFQQSDEWETVALIANKATAQFPDNVNFAHVSQTAEEILRADKKLASYLSRPERLSDVGIKTKATEFLKSIEPLLLQSPKLSKRADLLSREVESYSLKINVIVHSDNRSTLKVLGVGVIGEVNSKQIELKPGRYRFEASRKGYKTEILEVDVQQTIKPLEVTLMCKEKV
ncbi:tetratricopeptide repeat protein [Pseudoalteromonas xiamenensis]